MSSAAASRYANHPRVTVHDVDHFEVVTAAGNTLYLIRAAGMGWVVSTVADLQVGAHAVLGPVDADPDQWIQMMLNADGDRHPRVFLARDGMEEGPALLAAEADMYGRALRALGAAA
jgi:hypothetical protein